MDDSSDVVIIEPDADETDDVKKDIKKPAPEVVTITEIETSKPAETNNEVEAINGVEEVNDVEVSNEAQANDEVEGNKEVERNAEVETSKEVETTKEAEVTNETVDDIESKCVNGTDLEEKKESPAQSPCEIENMTVVDEDVDLISSDEEEKEKEKEKEKVKVEEIKPKENEKHKRSSKRKHNDSESSSSSKKRSSRSDSKSSNHNDAEVKKPLPLLEKYWKAVKDDPTDFTGWTYLLQYVDQANDIAAASEVYDDFLSRYPYCYGYWRKYADYLKKNGEKAKCEEIFEKGVKAIPLSVDLWIHYLNYMKEAYSTNEELVRNLFERSLKSCGLEFRSDRLWDAYVKWEIEGNRLLNVTSIFDRWLAVPTQGYVTVMEKFKEHVKKNPPSKILDPEEFFSLRNEVLNETKASNAEMESKLSDDAPPGEEAPEHLDKMNEEETKALKEKIISTRKERHKVTQKDALARWSYEENIKRPYFHVKPLEQCQLNNWKEYLDFEIKEGKSDRIILLFERCLIACALYEEFWIKFIEYLLAQPEVLVEKVREVFVRACTIHHTKKINIHLRWSAFEETYGNSLKAAQILEDLEKLCPNVLVVMLRRINIVRRRGEYEKVCAYYEQYIEANANKKEIASSLAIKYARFCCKIVNDSDKGVEVLKSAIEKNKDDNRLKLQLIDIYMSKCPVEFDEIVHLLDSIINATEDSEKKLLFAQRKLEFLEEFAEECTPVQKAQEEYESLLKVVAEKKKAIEEKKVEAAAKKNGAGEQSQQPTTVAYSTANPQTYYQTAPPPTYQTYPQGYVAAPYQQQPVYAPSDPNYGYQNWQSYGTAYNQQWPSGTAPQAGATSGYNYMY